MNTRHRAVWVLVCALLASSWGLAGDQSDSKLDHYQVHASRPSSAQAVLIRTFSVDRTDFGTAEKEGKVKAQEIAGIMKDVAPGAFSQAFVSHLSEAGVYPRVAALEGDSLPADALLIEGDFTVLNPGSRGKRYWVGLGAGRSRICVRGHVVDADGRELIQFDHCRSGTLGWFGGRAEGMMTTDVYQTAFRLADFVAAWGRGEIETGASRD